MLQLFLLRHGKAEKYSKKEDDFYRKLDRMGTAEVNQIGYILRQEGINIDQIISSGATRARETTGIMNHYLSVKDISYDDSLFLTGADHIVHKISKSGTGQNLLYVGHNFGISDAVGYLTTNPMSLSTSMLVKIGFEQDNWAEISRETGTILEIYAPDVLAF